jgi:hypothetical protein
MGERRRYFFRNDTVNDEFNLFPKGHGMRRIALILILLSVLPLPVTSAAAQTSAPEGRLQMDFRCIAEFGFLNVISHKIQFGKNGTYFDYVKNGGQDVLFPVTRFSAEMDVGKRNTFILLYQPLKLQTQDLLRHDVTIDNFTFPDSTGLNCLYNFPFYRASYLREILPVNNPHNLAVGLTLQIRNATIVFESTDGAGYRANRNIGLVPALKVRGQINMAGKYFLGMEADGIYAPVSYLNGSDNEVVGAILDASLRAGAKVKSGAVFMNVRYLGGGATGTSTNDTWPGDGYVRNWLHFLIVSTGFVYQI